MVPLRRGGKIGDREMDGFLVDHDGLEIGVRARLVCVCSIHRALEHREDASRVFDVARAQRVERLVADRLPLVRIVAVKGFGAGEQARDAGKNLSQGPPCSITPPVHLI